MERNYTKITIYQIQLTDEQIDMINAQGHDSVPAQKARMDVMFGSEGFKVENLKYYTAVMMVDAQELEEAFELTNLWNDNSRVVRYGARQSSSSVGDIFGKDGRYYMVDNFGFTELKLFNDEVEMLEAA